MDVRVIHQQHHTLMGAWQPWEADSREEPALRRLLNETKDQIAVWETSGQYLGQSAKLLKDQTACIEALLTQRAQEQARGY